MLLGILSDTHDRIDAMAAAVKLLQAHQAEFFIHCGDVGGPRILDYLSGLPSAFVFGNTDWDRAPLRRFAEVTGIQCLGGGGELHFGGKRIYVTHGDDAVLKKHVLNAQEVDYFLQGHTHLLADERFGRIRLINPGALHRTSRKTVALLDTDSDLLRILDVG